MSRTRRGLGLVVLVAAASFLAAERAGAGDEKGEPLRPVLTVQLGHSGRIDSVAFSPDGTHVLTGSADSTARVWEASTGKEVRRFEGHESNVRSVAFSPDGMHVLTGSKDGTSRLWETATGRVVRSFDSVIRRFDSVHGYEVTSVAFSPDGTHVLTGSIDNVARLWETATGRLVRGLWGHDSDITSVAFSADGAHVLTGSEDATARLWETATGKEVRRFQHGEEPEESDVVWSFTYVLSVTFSPDSTHILTGSRDGTAHLWETATGKEVRRFAGHGGWVNSVAFSPDGKHLLTGSYDYSARMWDLASGNEVRRFEHEEEDEEGESDETTARVLSVAFSPDGTHILTGLMDATSRLWETTTGSEVRRFEGHVDTVWSVAFSPDGAHVLTGSGDATARLWDVAAGREVRRFRGHGNEVTSVAFSPDGAHVLTGSADSTARLWETVTGREVRRFVGHGGDVTSVAFSPGGAHVLTGSGDRTARLWETATGKEVHRYEGHGRMVQAVAFSPDGKLVLTGSSDRSARLWETATGKEVRAFRAGAIGIVISAVFSPDGTYVLMCSEGGTASLWETTTDRVHIFQVHERTVTSAAFSPNGAHVMTGSWDGTARLWETATGKEVHRFGSHGPGILSVAFSPDGKHVLTGSTDRTARAWDTATGAQLCSMVSFRNGTWAVVAPDGRFDTNDLEEVEGLHWVMPDDPMRTLSVEMFMREYYEPRLLPRLLAGEEMRPVKSLTELNRAQPHVAVVSVEPDDAHEETVQVTVEVGGRSEASTRPGKDKPLRGGVYDLRLFRDGQVVAWRDGDLRVGEEDGRITFSGIRIPASVEAADVGFSAYAFNVDGVKSRTDRKTFKTAPVAEPRQGTAYVIALGIDAFADPAWNLSYAAADAKLSTESLDKALSATKAWARVVTVPLTSTADGDRARKDDLRAVLTALAGEDAGEDAQKRVSKLAQIEKACPADLVILAVSTHGLATDDGGFLLLPSDTAFGENGEVLPDSCISTDDLKEWLRPVDAGEMAMIVDACQSAASVEQEGFKPGPMGSRGFGQLAWNKKMRILAASQASEYALESRQLRHGLLTHALVREGLEAGEADAGEIKDGAITLREWLQYGESRVPALAEAIATGEMEAVGPRGPLRKENRPKAARVVQRPSLFDFSRAGRRETVIRKGEADGD